MVPQGALQNAPSALEWRRRRTHACSMRTMIFRGLASDKRPFRTVQREKFARDEGSSEARVQRSRSDAGLPSADKGQRLFGRFGHSCGKVSDISGGAAYPAFAQFASLPAQHQQNISERSAQTRHISELSVEYQTNIRGTSEHQRNIGRPSEDYQRSISAASANYQLRSHRHIVILFSQSIGWGVRIWCVIRRNPAIRLRICGSIQPPIPVDSC
jgi:hypothetical protein